MSTILLSLRNSSECVRFRFDAGVFPDVSGPIVVCGGCECARFTFVEGLNGPQLVRKGFVGGLIAAVKGPYRVCGWC